MIDFDTGNSRYVLDVQAVRKTYVTGGESLEVLKCINLHVEPGMTVAISGESGSGKSTLLNLVGGIDASTSGNILVNGSDITRLDEEELAWYRNQQVGFIFQFHHLLRDFTVLENVMIPSLIAEKNFKEATERAHQFLEDVDLGERNSHYPLELSGGERQRVAVARALMNDPVLILADEPTGNLDERRSATIEGLLFDVVRKYRKTMLLVTHDQKLCSRGDEHFVLEHGVLRGS